MSILRYILLLLIFSCATSQKAIVIETKTNTKTPSLRKHYIFVNQFFSGSCPSPIYFEVDRSNFGFSHFRGKYKKIFIAKNSLKNFDKTFTHELSHLCLFHTTSGRSTQEEFRFFDEGLASIIGQSFIGKDKSYRKNAFKVAYQMLSQKKISFKKMQKWSIFFGQPPKTFNFKSYQVGATFIYYILEIYHQKTLFHFFKSIKKHNSLEAAIKDIFSMTIEDFEQSWFSYIEKQFKYISLGKNT